MSKRIKDKIGEEKYNKMKELLEGSGFDIKDIDHIPNNFVPKNRFDEINTNLNSYKQEVEANKEHKKQISKLLEGTNAENVGELVNTFKSLDANHKKAIKDIETSTNNEVNNLKKSYKVKDHLRDNGVTKSKNVDLLYKSIDLNTINLDDNGNLVGITDVIKNLKTDYKELFSETKLNGKPPKDTDNSGGKPDGDDSKDIFDTLMEGNHL